MNFLGLAHRFRIPFRFGFSTNDPLRVLSLTPTFSVPRLLDSSVHMDLKLLAELDEVTEQLDRTEIGAAGNLTWPVARRMRSPPARDPRRAARRAAGCDATPRKAGLSTGTACATAIGSSEVNHVAPRSRAPRGLAHVADVASVTAVGEEQGALAPNGVGHRGRV